MYRIAAEGIPVTPVPGLRFRSYRLIHNQHRMRAMMQYIYDMEPEDSPVRQNYAPTLEPHTLWSKLNTQTYDEYLFGYMVLDGVWNPIMGGGYERVEPGRIAVLTRLFVAPHYRMRLYIQHLLAELVWIMSHKDIQRDTTLYISFNKCNQSLYEWFVRKHAGKSTAIGKQWPEVFSVFKPVGLRVVNHVEQYVCETTFQDLLEAYHGKFPVALSPDPIRSTKDVAQCHTGQNSRVSVGSSDDHFGPEQSQACT